MDLHIFFLREALDRLSECPDATVVVCDLRDDILRVLREIIYDDRLGLFAGVRRKVRPRRDLTPKEESDIGDGRVGQGSEIRGKSG